MPSLSAYPRFHFAAFSSPFRSFVCLDENISGKAQIHVWNLKPKAFASIKQFQGDLMTKIDYFFPRFMDFFLALPSLVRAVLNFTQFHLIDIFIVMLKSFVLCVSVCIHISFPIYPQEIFSGRRKMFEYIYFNPLHNISEVYCTKFEYFALHPHVVSLFGFALGLFWFRKQFFLPSSSLPALFCCHMKCIIHGFV